MTKDPVYRVCYWDHAADRWRPYVTRTTRPERAERTLRAAGRTVIDVTERPGRGVPMPLPEPVRGLRVYGGGEG